MRLFFVTHAPKKGTQEDIEVLAVFDEERAAQTFSKKVIKEKSFQNDDVLISAVYAGNYTGKDTFDNHLYVVVSSPHGEAFEFGGGGKIYGAYSSDKECQNYRKKLLREGYEAISFVTRCMAITDELKECLNKQQ